MGLKLFKITNTNDDNYDVYTEAIVISNSPIGASKIHPCGEGIKIPVKAGVRNSNWTNNPKDVLVELVGELIPAGVYKDVKAGDVILANYRHG